MVVAYFDCFSGICGDMILGALIDLGVEKDFFNREIEKLNLPGYKIQIKKIQCDDISATDVDIVVSEQKHHRNLDDINRIIDDSTLDKQVKQLSKKIFHRLAVAESKVHNTAIENIHFHEVGAVDSIIDIVGASIGLKKLNISKIFCSHLPLGTGFVKCEHGVLPVPVPATVELLKGVPVYQTQRKQELVTPTGAVVITTIAETFGEMPEMEITRVGYGAGKTKSKYPNVLKILLGELEQE
ncbi:MAG: nickel pincer cofactor biosynthesis protein LarC [Candidatus Thermoplasmatota archaeon]|nr:nickel pincer cofactor biosynthesis protein LarC [Candidatus Thermoplasmatota archaeon]